MTDDSPATKLADVGDRQTTDAPASVQWTEFEFLAELIAVIRSVHRASTAGRCRDKLAERTCDQLADSPLYSAACMADRPTVMGCRDAWTVVESDSDDHPELPSVTPVLDDGETEPHVTTEAFDSGPWVVVPLRYDQRCYGTLGVCSAERSVTDRERSVLTELGGVIGHALNAIETRHLLSETLVTEIEVMNSDKANPLVSAAERADCQFELSGLNPGTATDSIAFLTVQDAPATVACERLDSASDGDCQCIATDRPGAHGVLAWTVGSESLLRRLLKHGAHVTAITAWSDRARYTAEVASPGDVRSLLESVTQRFPATTLGAKRERCRPPRTGGEIPDADLEGLTNRQSEALEAAYNAGYYRWPRDTTAEDVAEILGISAPTLHGHLRKAENELFGRLFDDEPRRETA